jgi:glycosyltransferase involved in cell wall biosynthesis
MKQAGAPYSARAERVIRRAKMKPDPSKPPAKLKIATVYWGRFGAGATLMTEITEALAQDDRFDVFASPSLQSELTLHFPGARLLPIETFSDPISLVIRSMGLRGIIKGFVRRLTAAGVRAIVTIMPHVWGFALQREARRAGIATILVVHDADSHPGERRLVLERLMRSETQRSDHVITLSRHVAERLLARGDAAESRLTRLYHPILDFGPPTPKAASSAGSMLAAPDGQGFRLLFFGRILPYKGMPLLLEAFALLRTQQVDCTLRIAGRGRLDVDDRLKQQAGLTIEQRWIPPDRIANLLASAHAVVLPYLEASQSGVVAAAYGAGLPVVATPVGGLVEQILHGETGILAEKVGAAEFAAAIRRLIETPGLYETCRAGVARYAARHGAANFASALGDVIAQTVAQKAS